MRITVNREGFLEKIGMVQHVTDGASIPILSCLHLKAGKKGIIRASDLQTSIRVPVEVEVSEEGVVCMPSKKLYELTKELSVETFTIETKENQVKIKAGLGVFRLACQPVADFPEFPKAGEGERFKLEAKALVESIDKTLYAAATGQHEKYVLNGLLLHFTADHLHVVGTDGHRLAVASHEITRTGSEDKQLIISRKSAAEVKKILAGQDELR